MFVTRDVKKPEEKHRVRVAEKAFDKILQLLLIKKLSKIGRERI